MEETLSDSFGEIITLVTLHTVNYDVDRVRFILSTGENLNKYSLKYPTGSI